MENIAEVVINVKTKSLRKAFSYALPPDIGFDLHVGSRVLVPFHGRQEEGVVVGFLDTSEYTLKPIIRVLDDRESFFPEMVATAQWISDYYLCNFSESLRLFMVDKRSIRTNDYIQKNPAVPLVNVTDDEKAIFTYLEEQGGKIKAPLLEKNFDVPLLMELIKKKKLIVMKQVSGPWEKKKEPWLRFFQADTDNALARRPRQQALLQYLEQVEIMSVQQLEAGGYGRSLLHGLIEAGLAKLEWRYPKTVQFFPGQGDRDQQLTLTAEQEKAYEAIRTSIEREESDVFLLHGVTGSGKTEIYLRAAVQVVAKNQQVIILVPEIALTGQIIKRFVERFGSEVVVVHSKLSKGERYNNWLRMHNGESHICIGARSAVFSPVQQLGLVIVDEEHDPSYKQDEAPRYSAKETALRRAAYFHCPAILGSATPSVASYYKAQQGIFRLLSLTKRIHDNPLPTVKIVDMREELMHGNRSVLSDDLTELIDHCLEEKRQAIILLNRRGYATFVMCRKCGYVVKCDTCDVSMVYHKSDEMLRCHYCDAEKPVPKICPSCGSRYIKFFGSGTEKIEAVLREKFPLARIVRMDQDTTSKKNSGETIMIDFAAFRYDILLGTQMVAKGHDIPNVSAVGILSADSMLNIPSFEAGERTFDLLTQAAGRAGRGEAIGQVVLQTYTPEHYAIVASQSQDYRCFYDEEIGYRRELGYPPFMAIIKITLVDDDQQEGRVRADELATLLRRWCQDQNSNTEIIGPFFDIVKKIRNQYRFSLLLKGSTLKEVKKYIKEEPEFHKTGIMIDVDSNF